MDWIICTILSIATAVFGVRAYIKGKDRYIKIVILLGFLFAASYIINIPAFFTRYDLFFSGLVGDLVHVLQIVTVDANLMEFFPEIRESTANLVGPVFGKIITDFYIGVLAIYHLALPAISALTAVKVLFQCFSSFQLFFANGSQKTMFIFSEMNERSLQIMKSLKKENCVVIFANTDRSALDGVEEDNRKYICKNESISELKIKLKNKKDVYFFCLSDDENASLSFSLQLIERYSQIDEATQEHIHIYQFSEYKDYSVFIDSATKGMLDIQCFNECEMLLYDLLDRHPLYAAADKDIHVLLYGLAPINVIALRSIIWCGQLSGYSLKVSVVGKEIDEQIDDLRVNVPGLFSERYHICIYNCKSTEEMVEAIQQNCTDANYIVVGGDNDNDTMSSGILLRRLFYKTDAHFDRCPPIFCYVREPSKFNILKNLTTAESNPKRKMSYDLIPFGSISEIYTCKNIIDSNINNLSRNVHLAYEEIFSDGPIDVKEALKRYNVFEVNKRSNRAAALHIRYKLNLLGLDYTDDPDAEEVKMSDFYNEESLDKLARSEHDRWMAFLETEGWTTATHEEVNAYRTSNVSRGRHNCPLLKMHPYICKYEDLHDLSMDLEGKDTTLYDGELVVRIPDILGNKWRIASKTYKIIKKAPPQD